MPSGRIFSIVQLTGISSEKKIESPVIISNLGILDLPFVAFSKPSDSSQKSFGGSSSLFSPLLYSLFL